MASDNLDRVRELAPDLNKQQPRSPREELGGYELAARTLDKCRATLAGTNADFQFNCPMDQQFFAATGIKADDFKQFVATGADD
jgi:hypothetical protein